MKTVPAPGSVSTSIVPPLWPTMPCAVESPSPDDLAKGFVVKNGSQMRLRVA